MTIFLFFSELLGALKWGLLFVERRGYDYCWSLPVYWK
jgi:hypothetical protein